MTVIMKVLSEPSGEMHFMSMSLKILGGKMVLNIQLCGAESTSSDDEESNWNLPLYTLLVSFGRRVPLIRQVTVCPIHLA